MSAPTALAQNARNTTLPPFLRLPTEIRLMIYEHLLLPKSQPEASSSCQSLEQMLQPDYHSCDQHYSSKRSVKSASATSPRITVHIRTLDPSSTKPKPTTIRNRTPFSIRTSRFRSRTMGTTYFAPGSHNQAIHPAILSVCRTTHAEAVDLLYGGALFCFGSHVDAVPAFLADLTPRARARVRRVALVKAPLPYDHGADLDDWAEACKALAGDLPGLAELRLGVVAGKPARKRQGGWAGLRTISAAQFRTLSGPTPDGGSADSVASGMLEWAGALMCVRGLASLEVRPLVEHCPSPMSEGMAFWVTLSKNLEGGFAEWLRGLMVGRKGEHGA
ncbi:hypothetical protein BDY21DRAFT_302690 [Lineolata rhizophorae]|uniref:Uncharacterized protein n=1 Tax=Lineolata rhizophorae TaxID=578093 RepID=A0A6A6P171_9PEZI|nr:hypothetical protein BDY21DRAFT_302690 [Lineolata rhizophorae]